MILVATGPAPESTGFCRERGNGIRTPPIRPGPEKKETLTPVKVSFFWFKQPQFPA